MLFPMSVVLINLEGSFMYQAKILAVHTPCLFCNSIRSLLDEIKAISIPEKNAEQISVMRMTRGPESMDCNDFVFCKYTTPLSVFTKILLHY